MRRNPENFNYILSAYEKALKNGESIYLEAADLLDIYDYYADNFRNEDAQIVLMHAVKMYPDDEDVIMAHAYYYKNTSQWNKAKEIINKLSPDNIFFKLFYAEEALTKLNLVKTRQLVEEIGQSEDFSEDNALDIAEMFYEAGYYHLAEPWFEKCNSPEYAEYTRAASELADCIFRRGEYDKAISLMNKCIDEDPYDSDLWVQLAKIQYTAHKDEEALESCDYAIAANEDNIEAYSVRFNALLRLNKLEDMWEDLKIPRRSVLCSAENFLNLAIAFQEKDDHDKALATLRLGAQQYTSDTEIRDQIHRLMANYAMASGFGEDAHDLIFRHTDRENFIMRHISWAALLFIHERRDIAINVLQETIHLPNIRIDEVSELSSLLYNAHCYEEARNIWEFIFTYADHEEIHSPATLAYAAFRIHSLQFVHLLELALQKDLFTAISLLSDDFNIFDQKSTLSKARRLVRKWKNEQ